MTMLVILITYSNFVPFSDKIDSYSFSTVCLLQVREDASHSYQLLPLCIFHFITLFYRDIALSLKLIFLLLMNNK